ncbi:MAG TPA: cbb3-type cytochrome c oxidase subunit I [Candidatus Margulisiibacteriota bacterium]|nr:cbb3-type cytochrome c oxidase subunit I [Candidatus Margulisiibacteriota bacterium]
MIATVDQRPLVNLDLIRWHLVASAVFFAISLLGGLSYAMQFNNLYPFQGIEWLSPGRVRMVHTNMAAYGFIANAFIAGMLFAIPRLTRQPILSDRLGWFILLAWQLFMVLTISGQLLGYGQGIEWGETPIFIDPFIVVGLVLLVANLATPILRTKETGLYVSLWYFLAAFAWTGLVYVMGNYLPQFFVPGTAGAAITGLFIHDLVGLFVTPIGWGLMYFFVPLLLRKPIWSHALSLIGFWGLAFFYPMQGVHHFLYSPIPMYAQYGAIVATIAVEIVVVTVIVNFFGTLHGRSDAMRGNLAIRWFYTGMIMYAITCFQCAFQVTLTFQRIIHFTDWVVAHAHMVMFGVFGFWIMGVFIELWPRAVGRPWVLPQLLTAHFWLTVIGLVLMVVDLTAAGLVQGFSWANLSHWGESVAASMPFWWARSVAGLLIIAGQGLFFYALWATARQPAAVTAPARVAATAT